MPGAQYTAKNMSRYLCLDSLDLVILIWSITVCVDSWCITKKWRPNVLKILEPLWTLILHILLLDQGVEKLRDDNFETYWQSDGQLPHLVNIQFKRKTTVSSVAIYTDFRHDESYTPSKVSVRCGTNFNDLQEIEVIELKEPSGWVKIPLKDLNDRLVRSFMVQIAVLSNHQQGRDTHLRQIKIYSPVVNQPVTTAEFADWSTSRNEYLQGWIDFSAKCKRN